MGTNRFIVWLAISLASTIGGWGARASAQEQAAPGAAATKQIAVTVIDETTQHPLADATLRVMWSSHEERVEASGSGRFVVEYPANDFLVIVAEAPGHASLRAGYHTQRGRPAKIPAERTYVLPAAKIIGGRIVNEQGEPIAGATIEVSGQGRWDKENNTSLQFRQKDVTTDADGRWTFDQAPPDIFTLMLEIRHPEYVALRDRHSNQPSGDQPASTMLPAAIYDKSGLSTMQRGVQMRGTIVDPEGQPVADATVSEPYQQYGPAEERTRTNAQGEWAYRRLPGPATLMFEAANLAPLSKEVTAEEGAAALQIQMPRGWPLRGRVVDPQGRPRKDVRIAVETLGGDRARRYPVHWNGKTDAEGRFEWRNAPDDAFTLDIYKSQHEMRLSGVPVSRKDDEIVFTMHDALRFAGKVTDASTGEPITNFTVIPGMGWSGSMRLGRESAQTHESADGSYTYAVDFPRESHCLVFEADGYAPFQSGAYHNEDGAQTLDVALQPAAAITGSVARADGQPVGQARVYVGTSMDPVSIEGGKSMPPPNEAFFVEVDADGRFAIPQQVSAFALAAINDYGVAIVLDTDHKVEEPLMLQPWASVEAEVLDGGAPVAGRRVSIEGMYDPHDPLRVVHFSNWGETDADGRFRFTHVAPGQWQVTEWDPMGDHGHRSARFRIVEVRPGEQRRVATRGGGVRVVGRAALPEGVGLEAPLSTARVYLQSRRTPPRPDNWDDMTPEQRAAWQQEWERSDAGRRNARDAFLNDHYYNVALDDEGGFSIEGVQPGRYMLRIEAEDPAQPGVAMLCRTIKEHEVQVASDATRVDIGTFELEAMTRLRAGDEAPGFDIKGLDGEPLNLSDFRGKYVFLDFWATWCGPCKAEIPSLKALHQAMKDRDDFVIISLSLDNDVALPAQYVKDHGMTWTHGFLGKWSDDVVTKAYGVRGIPATFLIGPDGRVVLSNVRGAEAVAAVRSAIENPSPR